MQKLVAQAVVNLTKPMEALHHATFHICCNAETDLLSELRHGCPRRWRTFESPKRHWEKNRMKVRLWRLQIMKFSCGIFTWERPCEFQGSRKESRLYRRPGDPNFRVRSHPPRRHHCCVQPPQKSQSQQIFRQDDLKRYHAGRSWIWVAQHSLPAPRRGRGWEESTLKPIKYCLKQQHHFWIRTRRETISLAISRIREKYSSEGYDPLFWASELVVEEANAVSVREFGRRPLASTTFVAAICSIKR